MEHWTRAPRAGRGLPVVTRSVRVDGLGPVDLVIFDNDGVLVDSEALSSATLAEVLTAYGVPTTPAQCRRDFTGGTPSLIRQVIEARTGRPLPASFEAAFAARLIERFQRRLRPCPGIPALLDFLGRVGVPYCVASNGTRERIEAALRAVGLLDRFTGRIFSAAEVARPKPAPDLFLQASAALRVPADRCLVIEDTPPGIAAARAAGMRVWAPAGTYPLDELSGADRVSASTAVLAAELQAALAAQRGVTSGQTD